MVGSLPSSSIVSTQRPSNGASLKVPSKGVAWWSCDYARVPSPGRLTVCIYRVRLKHCMPYQDVANLVTLTKMNMRRQNALSLYKNLCCENTASDLPQRCKRGSGLGCSRSIPQSCAAHSASLKVSCRSAQMSHELQNLTILDGASWMHLHHCRCFQEHMRMLLQSLRALCLAPGGSGSVWKNWEALLRSPGVSGRIGWGFQTD